MLRTSQSQNARKYTLFEAFVKAMLPPQVAAKSISRLGDRAFKARLRLEYLRRCDQPKAAGEHHVTIRRGEVIALPVCHCPLWACYRNKIEPGTGLVIGMVG